MGKFITLICIIIFNMAFWAISCRKKTKHIGSPKADDNLVEAKEENCKHNNKMLMKRAKKARSLFMETLTEIGCQYELSEDKERIYFAYQGENFIADVSNEGWYVHIWNTHWAHVELCNIDDFSKLRKAINLSNLNCSTMTVYTTDKLSGNMDVHCKATILFIPQIPEIENYLRCELNDFFLAHQFINNEMLKLREE